MNNTGIMFLRIICLTLAAVFALCAGCASAPAVRESPTADWLVVSGSASIAPAGARSLALHEATLAAEEAAREKIRGRLRQLLATPSQTIWEAMMLDPYARSRILGLLAETRAFERSARDDQTVEVQLRVDLDYIRRICIYGQEAKPIGDKPAPAPPPPAIVLLGDCLAHGPAGAGPESDLAVLLEKRLERPILRRGSREASSDRAQELLRDAMAGQPGAVIVFLGVNDWLQGVPAARVERNLSLALERIQKSGAKAALVGFSVFPEDGYGAMFDRLAMRFHCLYAPEVLAGIAANPQMKADDVYPNASGYALIAQRIADAIGSGLVSAAGSGAPPGAPGE